MLWSFRYKVLAAKGCFNKELIEEFWRRHEGRAGLGPRKTVILELKKSYFDSTTSIHDMFLAYQFAQRLLVVEDRGFQDKFKINDEGGTENFVKFVKEYVVKTLDELRLKVAVARHVEWSNISLVFSDDFRLKDMRDKIIGKILENVENRI